MAAPTAAAVPARTAGNSAVARSSAKPGNPMTAPRDPASSATGPSIQFHAMRTLHPKSALAAATAVPLSAPRQAP